MKSNNSEKIYIFDTTLRDGQQSPGAGLTFEDNILYADYADKLKIDILEAGFPSASQTDYQIVKYISERMAKRNSNMVISGLCQLREPQAEVTMKALAASNKIQKARIHTYFPVDPNLLKASLAGKSLDPKDTIETLYKIVKLATSEGYEVEFSPEGYSRVGENFDFTTDLIRAALSAGAKIINCPDTIGGACIREGDEYFVKKMQTHADIMQKEFPNQEIIWSAHCHNDFGLALENTMNSIFDGPVRQIEGCINGVGERAGNAALEQCIIYLREFGNSGNKHFHSDININYLKSTSDFIAEKMLPRQPHSPIVGDNATRHTSGGHTNAILKNPLAYQPFDPKEIGSDISFVFGPLSGSNHAKNIIEEFGYHCPNDKKSKIAQFIKDEYHDRRKGITDLELVSAYKKFHHPIKPTKISYTKTEAGDVKLKIDGQFFDQNNIEALYKGENSALAALRDAVKKHMPEISINDYRSESINSKSVDAHSRSTIIVKYNDELYKGVAVDSDIEISALKAYIDAVNKTYVEQNCKLTVEENKGH